MPNGFRQKGPQGGRAIGFPRDTKTHAQDYWEERPDGTYTCIRSWWVWANQEPGLGSHSHCVQERDPETYLITAEDFNRAWEQASE